MSPAEYTEPCMYCGREPDECVCHLAPDFPDDPVDELDTDFLDWDYYEEDEDEVGGQEDHGFADEDEDGD